MSDSNTDINQSAVITETEEAEESALNYLATLPPEVARGAAVKAALILFALWEAENSKNHSCPLGRDDPSCPDPDADDRVLFARDLARYSKHVLWQSYPDECVRKLLQGLTPKAAVFVALMVVDNVCSSERAP